MTVTVWTPALALGHDEIDSQHQELFRRAARLVEAMDAGDRSAVEPLFDFLGTYVVDHFAAEERLMHGEPVPRLQRPPGGRTSGSSGTYQSLRTLHEESGASAAVVVKARTWLSEWLQNHIGSTDQLLGAPPGHSERRVAARS